MSELKLKLLNSHEKAAKLGISRRTLDRWVKENKIDYVYLPEGKINKKQRWYFEDK